jgi:hypothetical protein
MDDVTDVEWLRNRLRLTLEHANQLSDDIHEQDGLRLTGTVMRLDRLDGLLEECWRTLRLIYAEAHERDGKLANGTVGGAPSGGVGVVADVLSAASAGVHAAGSVVADRTSGCADVDVA